MSVFVDVESASSEIDSVKLDYVCWATPAHDKYLSEDDV